MANIQCMGVLGSGQMGMGIAQTAAQSGIQVLVSDQSRAHVEKAISKLSLSLDKQIEKGKLTVEAKTALLSLIVPCDDLKAFSKVDIAVEAASENKSLKFDLFRKLDEICRPGAILASNTSSISITEIAAQTKRPDFVAGMHFMNPVPVMKLVEGIRGIQTSNETFSIVRALAERMGKTFVESKDFPGFIVNRILMPMINEAVTTLYEGIASVEDIDAAMKLGTNQPMGPLTLADFIGLDTCLAIMQVLHDGLGDSKYRASPLLKQYVAAGWLGKKSGRGFYKYN